ncbi:YSIRK-type signal peptide-containing protein [Staphylococcus auricularis]
MNKYSIRKFTVGRHQF